MAHTRFPLHPAGRFPRRRRHAFNAPFFAKPSRNRNNIPGETPSPTLEGLAPWCWIYGREHAVLSLHKQLAAANTGHEKTALQRQIDATDRQIDQVVYGLYGLTDGEIRIVEGDVPKD